MLTPDTTIRELGGHISARALVMRTERDRIVYYRGRDALMAYSHLTHSYYAREFEIRNSENSTRKE